MRFTNRPTKHQISELSKELQSWLLSKCFNKINSMAWNPSPGIWLIRLQIGTIVASYIEADLGLSPISCTPGNLTWPTNISSCTLWGYKYKYKYFQDFQSLNRTFQNHKFNLKIKLTVINVSQRNINDRFSA